MPAQSKLFYFCNAKISDTNLARDVKQCFYPWHKLLTEIAFFFLGKNYVSIVHQLISKMNAKDERVLEFVVNLWYLFHNFKKPDLDVHLC